MPRIVCLFSFFHIVGHIALYFFLHYTFDVLISSSLDISWTLGNCCFILQLELHLHDMQIESENLAWDRKQLQEHLQTAIKEHKMMELILAELEEEHDKAIAKIELLEGEVNDFF